MYHVLYHVCASSDFHGLISKSVKRVDKSSVIRAYLVGVSCLVCASSDFHGLISQSVQRVEQSSVTRATLLGYHVLYVPQVTFMALHLSQFRERTSHL